MSLRRNLRDSRQARLLRQALAGNARDFRQLYRELHGPLLRYLAARTGRLEDAEEILSQVFHRFLRKMPDFDPGRGSVFAWSLAMTRSALIDHYRSRRDAISLDAVAEVLAAGSDPLASLIVSEEAERAMAWIGARSPETREMFALRFGEGLRYGEIAECMGIGEAAVKQRFSRALRDLRREFGSDEEKEGEVDFAVR